MRFPRAQAAMEFLMTYGWAILIMLVVISVLFYSGVFNAQSSTPSSCVLPAGFTCSEFRVDDYGNLFLDVGQATGRTVTVTGVGCGSSSNPTVWLASVSIPSGGHAVVTGSGVPCSGVSAGSFKGTVVITYSPSGSGLLRTARGTVSAPVQYGISLALAGPGWNSSFAYFRPVILNTGVSSSLTDFPAYFSFDSESLISAGKMNSSCKDARVVSASNQTLDFEIEPGSCNTADTVVWIRVPQTNGSRSYYAFLYYGNSSAADTQNRSGVWRNGFLEVYHLGDLTDSVTGGTGTNASAFYVSSGKIGGAYQFDGGAIGGSGVSFGSKAGLGATSAISVSAWANSAGLTPATGWINTIYSWGSESANKSVWLGYGNASGSFRYFWEIGNGTNLTSASPADSDIQAGRWSFISATFDSGTFSIFKNGALFSTGSLVPSSVYNGPSSYTVRLGRYSDSSRHYFNGTIDEVRVSSIARSPQWIAAEYSQTFMVGNEQANG